MLSRIGNSLFWFGRYVERPEHLARYIYSQFLSSMDAPLLQKREAILDSIARMNGYQNGSPLSVSKVLSDVTINPLNNCSILSSIYFARENARAARDSISTELWETTNTFYHTLTSYPKKKIKSDGPFDFCQFIIERTTIIRGLMDRTLIHDTGWSIVNFGIKLERAMQVVRILISKLQDVKDLDRSMIGGPLENYQWATLMKSCQAFDMSRRYYKRAPNRTNALEFLLLNPDFTNSVRFCLRHLELHLQNIDGKQIYDKQEVGFVVGKMKSNFDFLTVDELVDNAPEFLETTLASLNEIGKMFEKQYLAY